MPSNNPNDAAIQHLNNAQAEINAAIALLQTAPVNWPVTNRNIYQKPSLIPLGPAGTSFKDPTFSSNILRVTDGNTQGGTSFRTTAIGRGWSPDSQWFIGNTTGSKQYLFNRAGQIQSDDLPFYTEASFSRILNVLYGGGQQYVQPAVVSYDLSSKTAKLVVDLAALMAPSGIDLNNPRTYVSGVSLGANDILSVMYGGESQDKHHYVLVRHLDGSKSDLILDTVAGTINGTPIPGWVSMFLHFSGIDHSGRYCTLGATQDDINKGRAPNYIWDIETDIVTPMTNEGQGHGALGWGYTVNCPDNTDGAETLLRAYSAVNSIQQLILPYPTISNFRISNHLSWNNCLPSVLVPVIIANFRYSYFDDSGKPVDAYDVSINPWREWDDELIFVRTDLSKPLDVKRYCHHRNDVRHDTIPGQNGYWYTAEPQVSPDGSKCLVQTNWEKTLGQDLGSPAYEGNGFRQDLILVDLV